MSIYNPEQTSATSWRDLQEQFHRKAFTVAVDTVASVRQAGHYWLTYRLPEGWGAQADGSPE